MTAQAVITASFQGLTNDYGIGGSSVVAVPPSTDDPSADLMRVVIDGVEITRAYDPEIEGFVAPPPVPPPGLSWSAVSGTWASQSDTWETI